MKNKRNFIICFLILVAIIMSFLVSCDSIDSLDLEFDEDAYALYWNVVDNATSYVVKVIDVTSTSEIVKVAEVSQNEIVYDKELFLEGRTYSFSVQAFNKKGKSCSKTESCVYTFPENPIKTEEGYWSYADEDVNLKKNYEVLELSSNINLLRNSTKDFAIKNNTTKAVSNIKVFDMKSSDFVVSNTEKIIVIKKEYAKSKSNESKVKFEIEYLDGSVYTGMFTFLDVLPLRIVTISNSFSVSNNKVITITYDSSSLVDGTSTASYYLVKSVSVDGILIESSNYTKSKTENTIVLSIKYLSTLSVGEHFVSLFTGYGESTCKIEVTAKGNYTPYDVEIDYDKSYPNTYITWKCDESVDGYLVLIDDVSYSNTTGAGLPLFMDNLFDASGLVGNNSVIRVKAVKDSVEYASSAITMKLDLTNDSINDQLDYSKETFEFLGTTYNYVISSYEELVQHCYYVICRYESLVAKEEKLHVKLLVPYTDGITATNIKDCYNSFREALNFNITNLTHENSVLEYDVELLSKTTPYETQTIYELNNSYSEGQNNDVHYGNKTRTSSSILPIDNISKTAKVNSSFELYMALEKGLRPTFYQNSSVEILYNKARSILIDIIDDSMSDFEKVHAINDYLVDNVIYDRGCIKELSQYKVGTTAYDYFYGERCFYAEGALIDGYAVCNGFSSAFVILCGIENIQAYKVNGMSNTTSHSWVKVYLYGQWYICDPTFSNACDSTTKVEYLSHEYLFMDTVSSQPTKTHIEEENFAKDYYCGDTTFNIWASMCYVVDGVTYDFLIENKNEFEILVNYLIDISNFESKTQYVYSAYAISSGLLSSLVKDIVIDGYNISIKISSSNYKVNYITIEKI